MIPINVKKYKERQTELITKLEGMVQTCQTETRSFNEAEQGEYQGVDHGGGGDADGLLGLVRLAADRVDRADAGGLAGWLCRSGAPRGVE